MTLVLGKWKTRSGPLHLYKRVVSQLRRLLANLFFILVIRTVIWSFHTTACVSYFFVCHIRWCCHRPFPFPLLMNMELDSNLLAHNTLLILGPLKQMLHFMAGPKGTQSFIKDGHVVSAAPALHLPHYHVNSAQGGKLYWQWHMCKGDLCVCGSPGCRPASILSQLAIRDRSVVSIA